MNVVEISLEERKRMLCAELQTQRQDIAQRIDAGLQRDYPRSVTMRWLIAHPALSRRLLFSAVVFLLRRRKLR
jgi:hypothetical protein